MNINTALKSDRVCKALTGLRINEFRELVEPFKKNLLETRAKLLPNRQRKTGGGRRGVIPEAEQKLFTALLYLKCYPTYDLLGFIIGLDRTRSFRWIQFLFPILKQTLGRELVLPERQIHSVEEFIKLFPEVKDVFIDGTDRRIQKPRNIKRRNKLYSGKRKATTRKNIIIADEYKKILYLSPTKSGRRHDKRLLDKAGIEYLPPEVAAWVDTGFQGIKKTHSNTMIPKKKITSPTLVVIKALIDAFPAASFS